MNRSRQASARRGTAALEFAILAPVLLMLLLSGTDLSLWLLRKYRMDNTASTIANMVAAAQQLSATAFPASYCSTTASSLNYFAISSQVAAPMAVCGNSGATIISGITNNGTKTTIAWQERTGNATSFPSLFGAAGGVPVFPSGYTVPSGHSLIVAEVYSEVSTWSLPSQTLLGTVGASSMYSYAMYEPRLGGLVTPK